MTAAVRTVLVTGANRGLGAELLGLLRESGHNVIATSRDGRVGEQLSLTDAASITALSDALRSRRVRLDVLVNNAAIYEGTRADVLATNVLGTLAVTDALSPLVNDGGQIVMVSSGMGALSGGSSALQAFLMDPALDRAALLERVTAHIAAADREWPGQPYSASKLALNALTRVLARELAPRHIRVNAVCPGWCRTDMGGAGAPRSAMQGARSILAAVENTEANAGFFRDGAPIDW